MKFIIGILNYIDKIIRKFNMCYDCDEREATWVSCVGDYKWCDKCYNQD